MIFDKTTIIAAVKTRLTSSEKGRDGDIERAMSLCLDEISMKLRSRGATASESIAVGAGSRTVTLDGINQDLRYIYAIKYNSGTDEIKLEYYDPQIFLKDYDSPTATASTPSKYTQLLSSDGFPIVKFDCPTSVSGTLIVYYLPDLTPATVSFMRSGAPIVEGTLSYFWGAETERGMVTRKLFEDLIKSLRASDNFMYNSPARITRSRFEQDLEGIRWNQRARR